MIFINVIAWGLALAVMIFLGMFAWYMTDGAAEDWVRKRSLRDETNVNDIGNFFYRHEDFAVVATIALSWFSMVVWLAFVVQVAVWVYGPPVM
jgi:hypothetical protein